MNDIWVKKKYLRALGKSIEKIVLSPVSTQHNATHAMLAGRSRSSSEAEATPPHIVLVDKAGSGYPFTEQNPQAPLEF